MRLIFAAVCLMGCASGPSPGERQFVEMLKKFKCGPQSACNFHLEIAPEAQAGTSAPAGLFRPPRMRPAQVVELEHTSPLYAVGLEYECHSFYAPCLIKELPPQGDGADITIAIWHKGSRTLCSFYSDQGLYCNKR